MQRKYCVNKKTTYISFAIFITLLFVTTYLRFSKGILTTQTSTNAKAAQPTISLLQTNVKAITNGTEVGEYEYPYFVKLEERPDGTGGYGVCGGALINENFIVTSAHCVSKVYYGAGGTVSIAIGVTRFSDKFMGYYEGVVEHHLSLGKNNIYIPEQYVYTSTNQFMAQSYDIALIRLPTPLKGIPTLSIPDPATFVTSDDYPEIKYQSDSATYIGIGVTKAGETTPSKILMAANISLSKVNSNNKKYGVASYSRFITNPSPSIFNAFNIRKSGTCRGDSGGPVLLKKNDKLLYIGVVQGGPEDCSEKVNIAASVAYHSKWIIDTINSLGIVFSANSGTATPNENMNYSKKELVNACFNGGLIGNINTEKGCLQHSIICEWKMATPEENIASIQAGKGPIPGYCTGRTF